MQAILRRAAAGGSGGIAELVRDAPIPKPTASQVLIKTQFAGLNFLDLYYKSGLYPKVGIPPGTPFVLGVEGCGTVIEGGDSKLYPKGSRVAFFDGSSGSFAEYATVEKSKLVPIPDDVPSSVAVTLLIQGLTAHYLSHSVYKVNEKTSCVVWAASGGTGSLLCQVLSRACKAQTVIGITGKKISQIPGCTHVLDSKAPDLVEQVKKITNGAGVDVVYDSVGKASYEKSLNVLKPRGLCVFYGSASGPVPAIDPLLLSAKGSLFMTRPKLFDYITTPEELRSSSQELFTWWRNKSLNVKVDAVYDLIEATKAMDFLEKGNATGKILLRAPAAADVETSLPKSRL